MPFDDKDLEDGELVYCDDNSTVGEVIYVGDNIVFVEYAEIQGQPIHIYPQDEWWKSLVRAGHK